MIFISLLSQVFTPVGQHFPTLYKPFLSIYDCFYADFSMIEIFRKIDMGPVLRENMTSGPVKNTFAKKKTSLSKN